MHVGIYYVCTYVCKRVRYRWKWAIFFLNVLFVCVATAQEIRKVPHTCIPSPLYKFDTTDTMLLFLQSQVCATIQRCFYLTCPGNYVKGEGLWCFLSWWGWGQRRRGGVTWAVGKKQHKFINQSTCNLSITTGTSVLNSGFHVGAGFIFFIQLVT